MRLVNTVTLRLVGPILGSDLPPFAILSHTWGGDELSLQDFTNYQERQQHEHKNGFRKIQACCVRALMDGYVYAWIDTVCIDKTNSAELTEAINSMYQWYTKAAICYAYLEDLTLPKESISFSPELRLCRWFTRGWTLQELIAPKRVIFFNKNWDEVGEKKGKFAHEIWDIAGIRCNALLNPVRLSSIADRMSWASRRKTTKPEDLAYCLLGIFGVNMPLLYGEGGQRAFLRLQHEILRNSNDQSIFAWSIPEPHSLNTERMISLLAPSPSFFNSPFSITPCRAPRDSNNHLVANQGISLKVFSNPSRSCIYLKCRRAGRHGLYYFTAARLRTGPDEYVRKSCRINEVLPSKLAKDLEEITITLRTDIHDTLGFYRENRINYLAIAHLPCPNSGYSIIRCCPADSYDDGVSIKVSPFIASNSGTVFSFCHKEESGTPFFVALFCYGELGQPNSVGMEKDFVGVYNNTNKQSAGEFYVKNFTGPLEEWRVVGPSAARQESRDGLNVWRLQDGQFVHVYVSRHLDPALGYMGCVRILAGRSWEDHIKPFLNWGPFERGG